MDSLKIPTYKLWIAAMRLRTLPLSLSGIIVGSAFAYFQNAFHGGIFALALITTLLLQILSNFANDYGDGIKGTDAHRIGEKRLVASGLITSKQMKFAIICCSVLAFISALILIYTAFWQAHFSYSIFYVLLGGAAIIAAIKYTVGKNAYGYNGLGDVFVFIFFGLVSVLGSNFLYTHTFNKYLILAAISIGLLSVAVLNLNNMRDIENDKNAGKHTLVVNMGLKNAKLYHTYLLFFAFIFFAFFCVVFSFSLLPLIIVFFPLASNLIKVKKATHFEAFDPELKKVALSTFLLSILFWLTLIFKINVI